MLFLAALPTGLRVAFSSGWAYSILDAGRGALLSLAGPGTSVPVMRNTNSAHPLSLLKALLFYFTDPRTSSWSIWEDGVGSGQRKILNILLLPFCSLAVVW